MDLILLRNYLLPFIGALIITFFITQLIKTWAVKFKLIDKPDHPRKIHHQPIPKLGGLAIYLTFVVLTYIFWRNGYIIDGRITESHLWGIFIGGFILMLGGALDDKFNLKPGQQVFFPILASLIVIYFGLEISFITNPFGGIWNLHDFWWTPLALFVWLMGMMYTTKFLDGLDGLVSGISGIAALMLFMVSLFWDVPLSGTSILTLILAGSCFGFLIWNFHPAKIFLGEGGSLFLGFMLAVLSVISGAKIATTLLIMGLPILDVMWVIYRRIFKEKKSAFIGDRKHLHFRLLDAGLTQSQAVLFLYLIALIFGSSALFQRTFGKLVTLLVLIILMIVLGWWLVGFYQHKKKESAD